VTVEVIATYSILLCCVRYHLVPVSYSLLGWSPKSFPSADLLRVFRLRLIIILASIGYEFPYLRGPAREWQPEPHGPEAGQGGGKLVNMA
jgi:hypothetical protein